MAKRRDRTLDLLDEIAALAGRSLESSDLALLEKALGDKSNLVAAAAVKRLEETGDRAWLERLQAVFWRFLDNPIKTDPGCVAKLAVVKALQKWEAEAADLYRRGISHVQPEPVRGGTEDTAAELRGQCLVGLVALGDRESMFWAVPLLVDPEPETRFLAVQALGQTGVEAAELLLRMKAHGQEEDARVTGACFSALLQLNPDRSLAFVAGFLKQARVDLVEAAAIALGESRLPEAWPYLQACWDDHLDPRIRTALLLPIALLRTEEAIAFLLGLIAQENAPYAATTIQAMGIFHGDQAIYTQVAEAVAIHPSPEKNRAFERYFEDA